MKLCEDNFLLYAAHHYDMCRAVSTEEFEEDLKRIQYVKRLLKRYVNGKELKTRLILNHIIVIYNCFGQAATNMLFMKLWEYKEPLKPFIVFLNYMPEKVIFEQYEILDSEIGLDSTVINELRKI